VPYTQEVLRSAANRALLCCALALAGAICTPQALGQPAPDAGPAESAEKPKVDTEVESTREKAQQVRESSLVPAIAAAQDVPDVKNVAQIVGFVRWSGVAVSILVIVGRRHTEQPIRILGQTRGRDHEGSHQGRLRGTGDGRQGVRAGHPVRKGV
jgi:hypothetical protein